MFILVCNVAVCSSKVLLYISISVSETPPL